MLILTDIGILPFTDYSTTWQIILFAFSISATHKKEPCSLNDKRTNFSTAKKSVYNKFGICIMSTGVLRGISPVQPQPTLATAKSCD